MAYVRHVLTLVALLATSGCVNGIFYQPNRVVYQTPARQHLAFKPVTFTSVDGTRLTGWFVPAISNAQGTVVHFHGNAQNMTAHFGYVDWLPAAGFNVFVFDYRGYGASEGRPARRPVYEDSLAALRYVATHPEVDPNRLIVFGQSLGGANAIAVLARHAFPGVRAVIIDSSYLSYRRIVRDKIALIPLLSLLRWPLSFVVVSNGYSPDDGIRRLPKVPVLLIHGTSDAVIPYSHSERLYALAREPKAFWTVHGGRHTDAFVRRRADYCEPLLAFMRDALVSTNAVGETAVP